MLAALLLALVPAAARGRLADGAARLLRGWGLLIVPMLGWLALYAAFPGNEETHPLFDDGPSHLHYLMAFGAGWLLDRKSVVAGKRVPVRVGIRGRRIIQKKT